VRTASPRQAKGEHSRHTNHRHGPPKEFNVARVERVFSSMLHYVELEINLGADLITLELKNSASRAEVGLHSQMALLLTPAASVTEASATFKC
jgi:hypothetical protein